MISLATDEIVHEGFHRGDAEGIAAAKKPVQHVQIVEDRHFVIRSEREDIRTISCGVYP